jgi:hypothetical protein
MTYEHWNAKLPFDGGLRHALSLSPVLLFFDL